MEYQVISGDSHVDMTWMPGDLWVANAPPRFQETAPRVVETNAGPRWWAEGRQLGIQGGLAFSFNRAVKERSRRISAMSDAGFYEEGLHPTTPHLRLRDMERDGVEAEVLYGLSGTHLQFQDPELLRFMYQVYYQWAADFCASYPGRWAALAPLVIHDPEAAAEDLRYAARLGLKGADLPLSNSARPLYHRDWDALWAAAAECGMPVSFHSLGLKPRPLEGDDVQTYKAQHENVRNAMFQLGGIEALGSILVFGRLPALPGLPVRPWGVRHLLDPLRPRAAGRCLRREARGLRTGPEREAQRVLAPARPLDLPGRTGRGDGAGAGGRGPGHLGLRLPPPRFRLAGVPGRHRAEPEGPTGREAPQDHLRERRPPLRLHPLAPPLSAYNGGRTEPG